MFLNNICLSNDSSWFTVIAFAMSLWFVMFADFRLILMNNLLMIFQNLYDCFMTVPRAWFRCAWGVQAQRDVGLDLTWHHCSSFEHRNWRDDVTKSQYRFVSDPISTPHVGIVIPTTSWIQNSHAYEATYAHIPFMEHVGRFWKKTYLLEHPQKSYKSVCKSVTMESYITF